MIYVRRDPALIPESVLRVAERAQAKLETLPQEERKAFIENKSHVWRKFCRYLKKMSYGKCWYSESFDVQSFNDVDHFRPKKEAKRSETKTDDGYPWLAFSWENFRYSSQRCNRLSTDEATDETVGKGAWFPLLDGSPTATWDNRAAAERPVLLDPTVLSDVDLLNVGDDGRIQPSIWCVGAEKTLRVNRSIEVYGLNLPDIVAARARVMRDVSDDYANLMEIVAAGNDMQAIDRLLAQLRRASSPESVYSLAARACLSIKPNGMALCAMPEHIAQAA